ncbi:hypothetical protein HXX76_012830 [Chlamydomonas incerta]|uniref:Uncharacterized protein n=1 Tax=Chlamydomonas incerta TaxID=51695 RepID=A0A835SGH4_CHLIN|nr:hypothetical protein HXX76_012830 [Chlamydomonas incerta]|eukprot:KAG2426773.1 hypothetical protein HXX76_012830 [Chlamydomonas incerta]
MTSALSSALPSGITTVTSLTRVDLSGNDLTGGPRPSGFPVGLAALTSLQYLSFSGNSVSQVDSVDYYQVTSVEVRGVTQGSYPTLPNTISQMTDLLSLTIAGSALRGVIPQLPRSLTYLELSDNAGQLNSLGGSISILDTCTNLVHLDLHGNNFNGYIDGLYYESGWGSRLTNLQHLYMNNLSFRDLPPEWSGMTALRTLSLLETGASVLRAQWSTLVHLTKLAITGSLGGRITGTIPIQWFGGPGAYMSSLEELSLANNELTGPIPASITRVVGLRLLDLSSNRFNAGPRPTAFLPDLPTMLNLRTLLLGNNPFLSGTIPVEWENSNLATLGLEYTSVCGPARSNLATTVISGGVWPEFCDDAVAKYALSVTRGYYAAADPYFATWDSSIAVCSWEHVECGANETADGVTYGMVTSIQIINVVAASIGALLHSTVSSLTRLQQLTVRSAYIYAPIPTLPASLTLLDLSGNFIGGSFDFANSCNLLVSLDLTGNEISGTLPPAWSSFSSITVLRLDSNRAPYVPVPVALPSSWSAIHAPYGTGALPPSWSAMSQLTVLQLTSDAQLAPVNGFSGPIPPGWFNTSGLTKLQALTLSGNTLSGSIPTTISRLNLLTKLATVACP